MAAQPLPTGGLSVTTFGGGAGGPVGGGRLEGVCVGAGGVVGQRVCGGGFGRLGKLWWLL